MNTVIRVTLSVVATCALLSSPPAAAQNTTAMDLQKLLEGVKQGRRADRAENERRIREFLAVREEQEELLQNISKRREELEERSAVMEARFEENELLITDLENRLKERMGGLKELFGVLQQTASDAQAQFFISLSQLDHPDRNEFLVDFAGRMGQANRLPAIAEIERLWFELQREMTESGRMLTRTMNVVSAEGIEEQREVTRVGLFNVVSDGKYLQFIPETGRLLEFGRQPGSRYMGGPRALATGEVETFAFAVDPVRGQLLQILTQAPNITERIAQGGAIGYTIIGLGVAGLLLALTRWALLLVRGMAIKKQLQDMDNPREDNALGRILLAARADDVPDAETLELRMGDAVMREMPRITSYIPILKIIAAVAPLMGLLGTVTGMIVTFQAITLFGAGDPRLMAGGISQALMTTVLGLCVAIPMLLLHNFVQMRAKTISDILQNEALGQVAERTEYQVAQSRQEPPPPKGMAA
jgi:biopolymer transport protein ExbB